MNKSWHELYSDFSMLLLNLVKPVINSSWEDICNPDADINNSIDYWSECPKKYKHQARNNYFAQQLNVIKDLPPEQRYLSGVNILFLLITEEEQSKTIRLCFPTDLAKFKEAYFPFTSLDERQYPIAQFALADMSWETLIGEGIHRSLTGEIISLGEPRYIKDVREYRKAGKGKEGSIRPDVDDDIGFLSLVYVPLIKNKIYILLHSPVCGWFSEGCAELIKKKVDSILLPSNKSLDLMHSFMQHGETEAKRTGTNLYKDLLDILLHSRGLREFKDLEDFQKERFHDVLSQHLWEQESLGQLLSDMPFPKNFKLKEKIRNILSDDIPLKIKMERDLGMDLSVLEENGDYTITGVQEILWEVLWELLNNAQKYANKASISIKKVNNYAWKGNHEIQGASILINTEGSDSVELEKYMTLRFGIPYRSSDKKSSFGLWLVNYLVHEGGGILRTSLMRNHQHKMEGIEKYRKGIEFSITFPLVNSGVDHDL